MTNKDLILEIRKEQKKMAESQLDFAGKVSSFMNEQTLFNSKVLNILESDEKTKKKGLVEQQQINTSKLRVLENQNKIVIGVWIVLASILSYFKFTSE